MNANVPVSDLLTVDQLIDDPPSVLAERNGIPHAVAAAGTRGDRCRYADHLALEIDQRAAAVARIDPCVRLDQVAVVAIGIKLLSEILTQRAHDAE